MTIPTADQKLIGDLHSMLDQLDQQRRKLYTRRAGCACQEDHLCAHHAAIWNHLQAASDELARAISYAQSEG